MNYPLIIGLGSHHGDDQFGWLVVERLRALGYPAERLACLKHPAALLDLTDPDAEVVICDACSGIGHVGAIHQFQWPTDQLIDDHPRGSHDLPLGDVMLLGRSLSRFPSEAQIWAVEGGNYAANEAPSAEVRVAVDQVADKIWREHCHA